MPANNDGSNSGDDTHSAARWLIRILISGLAGATLWYALRLEPPSPLPSVALGREFLYRTEVFLLLFYAGLLILTPLFQGVIKGRLPTEISARGAKFDPEDVAAALRDAQTRIAEVESVARRPAERLIRPQTQAQRGIRGAEAVR